MNADVRAGRTLGARLIGEDRCMFRLWAPRAGRVEVVLPGSERRAEMQSKQRGCFEAIIDDVYPGDRYLFRLNGKLDRPDPASRFQPDDVHGPSAVVTDTFEWNDQHWRGIPLSQCIFYELHIGTFTEEGTFDAVIAHLDELRELGVTVIEIMPVAQFPGSRNWGYDGVLPFAVQNSYGGPDGMKRFVDACHQRGLAVALDVVYNHLGPEGNYLDDFGPYFTDKYHTPWGRAMNFDGPGSDEVRRYFIENALMWVDEFHVDALRLDAVHAIFDQSAYPFLHELTDAVHAMAERLNRQVHVIAESDLNDPRLIRPAELGGFGMDGQWSDDFHHALHTLLTGERDGYYRDFGSLADLAKAMTDGYVYDGRYSVHRRCRHGASARDVPGKRFVVCAQNHDQVGNRARGDRLTTLVSFEQHKLAAAVTMCSPYLPLLFMGEEYAETNPFLYFVSHSDPELVEAVRKGRREEFAAFAWQGEVPDPQSTETFERSRLDRTRRDSAEGQASMRFYRALIKARKSIDALANLDRRRMRVTHDDKHGTTIMHRWGDADEVLLACNFSDAARSATVEVSTGEWRIVLDSADAQFGGPGSRLNDRLKAASDINIPLAPHSVVMLRRPLSSSGHEVSS